jgi:hypothetical protein
MATGRAWSTEEEHSNSRVGIEGDGFHRATQRDLQ